jgi:hypothetical protein
MSLSVGLRVPSFFIRVAARSRARASVACCCFTCRFCTIAFRRESEPVSNTPYRYILPARNNRLKPVAPAADAAAAVATAAATAAATTSGAAGLATEPGVFGMREGAGVRAGVAAAAAAAGAAGVRLPLRPADAGVEDLAGVFFVDAG